MYSDLTLTLRSLLRTPGSTVVAVLTLALGIGATAAIFSVVNAVLLRPLPYAQPERLARIYTEFPNFSSGGLRRFQASTAEYFHLRRETKSWQSVEAWTNSGVNLSTAAEPMRSTTSFVTGGLLASLGVAPALGRLITPVDDEPGAALVAVISHHLWQRAFGGDQAVLGRDVLLNNRKHTLIGVMPEGFTFPISELDAPEVWVPLQIDPRYAHSDSHDVNILGRLKPDFTLGQAQAELDTLVQRRDQVGQGHRFDAADHTVIARGLHDEVVLGVRPALRVLMGAVSFLLLIAAVNVGNLLLVRAEGRRREIAVRRALGAGLWRLSRQFAAEGILLSLMGTACGLLLAWAGLELITFTGPVSIPRADETGIDVRVIGFAIAISGLTALVFSMAPLVHVARGNPQYVMKDSAASVTETPGPQRFRQMLVVSQLALALVLLTGTGLMLRAFWKLQDVHAGFQPEGVTTLFVALPDGIYPGEEARNFWTVLQDRLSTISGVESAALTTALPPVNDTGIGFAAWFEGFVPAEDGAIPTISTGEGPKPVIDYLQVVSGRYFDTLTIPLAAGRYFDARDGVHAPKVAMINQTTARAIWGNDNPIGRRIQPVISNEWHTVVGVVADVKNNGIDRPTGTEVYLPHTQMNVHAPFLRNVYIAVRSATPSAQIVSAVRRAVRDIDPTLPLTRIRTLDEVLTASQSHPRLLTVLLTSFAGVALLLAAVGVYGVISCSVAQRTREFGVRMAVGAQAGSVLNLVLARAFFLTICGVLVGLAGAYALTGFLSGFLFRVTPTDPATFAIVPLLLGVIAMFASYIPALRAARVDPVKALRSE